MSTDPDRELPFPGHRRYYVFIKVAIVLFALWLAVHFLGLL